MVTCFLALGSNLGDREGNLREAVRHLKARGIIVAESASVYSTEPKEIRQQPWFLNTVLRVDTSLEPEALMAMCLEIEAACGRERVQPNGPRTLDIDIVLYEDRVISNERLTIPHPRYRERRFVVEPLAEIGPDVLDPVTREPIRRILRQLGDDAEVRKAGPPLV